MDIEFLLFVMLRSAPSSLRRSRVPNQRLPGKSESGKLNDFGTDLPPPARNHLQVGVPYGSLLGFRVTCLSLGRVNLPFAFPSCD